MLGLVPALDSTKRLRRCFASALRRETAKIIIGKAVRTTAKRLGPARRVIRLSRWPARADPINRKANIMHYRDKSEATADQETSKARGDREGTAKVRSASGLRGLAGRMAEVSFSPGTGDAQPCPGCPSLQAGP